MGSILYYSNYCNHCKNILLNLSRNRIKENVHFVCIDKRTKKGNDTFAVLETKEILIPPTIKKVPSLLLLNRGNMIIEGDDVCEHIIENIQQDTMQATDGNGEPKSYGMNDFGNIQSDTYSFLDQDPNELQAKGNGGLRQTHNYTLLNNDTAIETPVETYKPDTISNSGMSYEKMVQMRNKDVPRSVQRM